MLYPKSNCYRYVHNLNGVWQFKTVSEDYLPTERAENTSPMAVPASMNEIVTERKVKDHVGKVVYEKTFSLPLNADMVYRLRIGATSHKCEVYLNGKHIGGGINGFFPIDLPLENLQEENRISVVIDNRLTFQTLPPGRVENGRQVYNHDFYNFTGIHRDVLVYALPKKHIRDIVIKTVVDGDYSLVSAKVDTDCETVTCKIRDAEGNIVALGGAGLLRVPQPHTWSPESPYLYTLIVETECDKYEERFGIRKIFVDEKGFYLNDKPVYFKGFGMHEDFYVIGKGNNTAVSIRDFELLKWMNANSFRTSHYPYSEEMMELADEYGFMVINEVPAVGMHWWGDYNFGPDMVNAETAKVHKELIRQLMERDKNHPCIVMFSVANEPATHEEAAGEYFRDVIAYARTVCDLPLTLVEFTPFNENSLVTELIDVVCINRYYAWYTEHAQIDVVYDRLQSELHAYYEAAKKPIIVTEFGADTLEGVHMLPAETFSEEWQEEYLIENFRAIDSCEGCIGEHIWNLADFKTKEGLRRPRGNRKGVFTRDRQPKLTAHYVRKRWKDK